MEKILLEHGLLGVALLALGLAVIYLERTRQAERAANEKRIAELEKKHETELSELRDLLDQEHKLRVEDSQKYGRTLLAISHRFKEAVAASVRWRRS